MHRQRLLIALAWCGAACAQIAGFEQLSGREASGGASGVSGGEAQGGTSPASAGRTGSAGSNDTAGGSIGTGTGGVSGGTAAVPEAGAAGMGDAGLIGGCNRQMLYNADFEAGPVQWQHESTWAGIRDVADIIVARDHPALVEAQVQPFQGDYLAWLGGVPDSQQGWRMNLTQEITIPEDATRLVISGRIRIHTLETENDRYDQLDISLQTKQDFWSFHVWDNRDAGDWRAFEQELLEDHLKIVRGRTVTFTAEAMTDAGGKTSFWLDALQLIAECGR
jgi:hypothetical protein